MIPLLNGSKSAWDQRRSATRTAAVLGITCVLGLVGGDVATARATTSALPVAASPPTRSVIIRPVTSAGQPARGFHARTQQTDPIDCSTAAPSPSSVDRNVDWCAPEDAYAIACWQTVTAHHALCMFNPSTHRLYRVPLTGSFASTAVVKARTRAPLLIVLADGARCSIRDGGAWGPAPKAHPNWAPFYGCSKRGVVWGPPHAKHYGINESRASWTVRTSAATTGKLTIRRVKRAYFVGTASG
jgi:hypothetical protein